MLRWFLVMSLMDRVPLPLILKVEQADTEKIVDTFMADNATKIEQAISKIEVSDRPGANVVDVVDVLIDDLLVFARQHGRFLDKPLSPYAGLKR